MGYDKLERNLIDIIKEEQAKLGFFKEDIRLYYPLSSLNHFFSATDNADEMQARLNALPTSITEKLGQIEISHKGDRFCFHIPKEGTVYVHDNTAPNEFIKSLVELVAKHDCTMNEILDLFHTYSQNIITEEINNDEFDRLIRFADKPEDASCRKITQTSISKEECLCVQLQLIKQKIFILEEHWTTNFLTAIRLRSLQGIIRFLSGMPVQNKRTMRSSAWLM